MSLRRNLNAGSRTYRPARAGGPDWQTEEAKMTPAQVTQLRALAEEAGEPDAFDETLSQAEAALRISALRAKVLHERHSGMDRFRT